MDEDYAHPKLTTPEQVAGYLALKHANGASMAQILEWHTEILLRLARDYVETWDNSGDSDLDYWVIQGAYYVLNQIEDSYDWPHIYE